jgi:excisionase family DNA binding protein
LIEINRPLIYFNQKKSPNRNNVLLVHNAERKSMDQKAQTDISNILDQIRTIASGVRNASDAGTEPVTLSRGEMMHRAKKVTQRLERLQTYLAGWLTTDAAATLTGYSTAYLRRLASQGRIKARKVGRDWQIHRENLLIFYEKMRDLGKQRHNPWRHDLTKQGRGRKPK